jgi:hypothetical protein
VAIDLDKLQEFPGRFAADLGAAVAAGSVGDGHRSGLYQALAAGPARAEDLAARTQASRATSPDGWPGRRRAQGGHI